MPGCEVQGVSGIDPFDPFPTSTITRFMSKGEKNTRRQGETKIQITEVSRQRVKSIHLTLRFLGCSTARETIPKDVHSFVGVQKPTCDGCHVDVLFGWCSWKWLLILCVFGRIGRFPIDMGHPKIIHCCYEFCMMNHLFDYLGCLAF